MKEVFLTTLRNLETPLTEFRTAAHHLCDLLAAEAINSIPLASHSVHTPLGFSKGAQLSHQVILIAILRAGLIFLPSFQKIFSEAPIGFFGIRRDEETANPRLYYENLPKISDQDWILLLDPMLATGGSSSLAIHHLSQAGASLHRLIHVSVLAAQEGIDLIYKQFPSVKIITAAIDPALNSKKFIVPGLGDFGDRYFGT